MTWLPSMKSCALVQVLVELGLVTGQELAESIATEFNPIHIGFHDEFKPQPDIIARDVLNLGVNPRCFLFPCVSALLHLIKNTTGT